MSEPVLTPNQHGPLAGSTSVESSVWTKGFSSEELKAVWKAKAYSILEMFMNHNSATPEATTSSRSRRSVDQLEVETTTSSRSRRSAKSHEGYTLEEILRALFDSSPAIHKSTIFLPLTTIRILTISLISHIGGYFLRNLAASLAVPYVLALIGAFGVPAYFFYFYPAPFRSELISLLAYFGSSVIQGLFVGAGLAHLKIESEPFMGLTPLVTTLSLFYMLAYAHHRVNLFYCTSISLLAHCLIGAMMGSLSSRPYQILTGLYTFSLWCFFQLDIYNMKNIEKERSYAEILAENVHVWLVIASKCIVYGIYGIPIGNHFNE
ncbi:hypothetical protein CRE_18752 [Caenorhabditis remanei]|uniref:Uncharacterized protein n=1 Tax=Caenorhabditis remanei TaxID=31234 RepID=E3LJS8_CAERE|nr:hypothetical protein CRE_18752 [Caenorhabditis remanei]